VALNAALLALAMRALVWALPGKDLGHIFLPAGLMLLLLCLAQSAAAQRTFGGEERLVAGREAGVCSLRQVLLGFVGKDLASLAEILLATLCYCMAFWPEAHTFASGPDLFAIGFACLYCIWGLNFIWSVLFPPHVAMLFGVTCAFLSFLFAGLKPEASKLVDGLGGYGKLLLLASPIRWSMSHFIFRHVTGRGSTYFEGTFKDTVSWMFGQRGFRLDTVVDMRCPAATMTVIERWRNNDGLVCHSGQLFLLGVLFRFIAAMCLLLSSSSTASGGQLPLGFSSKIGSRVLRDLLYVLLACFVVLQVLLLGETH